MLKTNRRVKTACLVAVIAMLSSVGGEALAQGDGLRISLEMQHADLRIVLDLLAKQSGCNIVVPSDIRGRVTVSLRNSPWRDALDIITRSVGCVAIEDLSSPTPLIRISRAVPSRRLCGDVNDDGVISMTDAAELLQAISRTVFDPPADMEAFDLDRSGSFDMMDCISLLQRLLRSSGTLPFAGVNDPAFTGVIHPPTYSHEHVLGTLAEVVTGHEKGRAVALADVARDRLQIMVMGLPRKRIQELQRRGFGGHVIRLVHVNSCDLTSDTAEFVRGYNEVARDAIVTRHGPEIAAQIRAVLAAELGIE